jgi:methionyl-tRNA formyltransferase
MKLVFMGSGTFSLPSLESLLQSRHEIVALITQPDKPAGRGHRLRMPPTKSYALEHDLPVHQPAKMRAPDAVALVEELDPECIVVVAYGQIIPKSVLAIPPRGIINVHGSILPAYRGAAPIQWAIARGERETGVTTMLMDEGLDTGPILLTQSMPIEKDDTSRSLTPRLAEAGATLLLRTLDVWESGDIEPTPQDDDEATLAPRIRKEDGRIDWSMTSAEIDCRIRAFDPWPAAWIELGETPLKLWRARPLPTGEAERDADSRPPGTLLGFDGPAVVVSCGSGTRLRLEEVQAAGKQRLPAADFFRGRRLEVGDRLYTVSSDPS